MLLLSSNPTQPARGWGITEQLKYDQQKRLLGTKGVARVLVGPGGPWPSRSPASQPVWGILEELVAHDSDQGQKNSVFLEVHLLVTVLVQVTHQLLQALLIHLLLKVTQNGSEAAPHPTPLRVRAQPSLGTGLWVSGRQGAPWELQRGPVREDRWRSLGRSPAVPAGSTQVLPKPARWVSLSHFADEETKNV